VISLEKHSKPEVDDVAHDGRYRRFARFAVESIQSRSAAPEQFDASGVCGVQRRCAASPDMADRDERRQGFIEIDEVNVGA
jgi:hypothetical protein